jgi:hypothetical protein
VTASCFVFAGKLSTVCPSADSVLQWILPCGQGLLCVDCLQVIAGCVSSLRVESLEDLWSKLFSRQVFGEMSERR